MSSRLVVRLVALLAVLGVGISLTLVPAVAKPGSCGKKSGCTSFQLQHAGATFGWYPVASRYEFKGGVPSEFTKKGKGGYSTRNGMLELRADENARLSTTWKLSARTGRWETRFRTDQLRGASSNAANYTLKIALVPGKRLSHCGGQGVTILSYQPKKSYTARFEIDTLPANRFAKHVRSPRTIGDDQWHTVAVEIKPNRISFYLDAQVVAKETRPAALLDVPLKMKFSLIPVAHTAMKDTRLDLDWARYWTLNKKGKHQDRVKHAPGMNLHHNAKAC